MELMVLGASASMPAAGDACSGFLVRDGQTNLVLDLGSGALANLRRHVSLDAISAIMISHFHPDHFLDLVPLRYGLSYGFGEPVRPPVWVQRGGIDYLRGVGRGLRDNPSFFDHAYELHEYAGTEPVTVGSLEVSFCRTTHDLPTFAMAVTDGRRRLVYGADTQESAALEAFAAGADLLLLESTYLDRPSRLPSGNHLTARQAGELAHRARAGRLMLTHFWAGEERAAHLRQATEFFAGPTLIATAGARYVV